MYTNLVQVFGDKSVAESVQSLQQCPSTVLSDLRKGVLKHLFGKYRTGMIPNLEQLVTSGEEPPLGVFTVGDWGSGVKHNPYSKAQWLVIDWKAVIHSGAHYLCDAGNLPALAVLAWGMIQEPASRRFLPLAEILQREVVQACAGIYNVSYDYGRYPLLSPYDRKLRKEMLPLLFEDGAVYRNIRRNFRNNFREYTTDLNRLGPQVLEKINKVYPEDSAGFAASHYLSVFSILRSKGISRKKLQGVVHAGYDEDSFYNNPTKSNPRLYELSHMCQLETPAIDGVWRYKDKTHSLRSRKYLIIHMGRYAEYRTNCGCDFYNNHLKKRGLRRGSMLTTGVYFVEWFREKFPRFDLASNYKYLTELAAELDIFKVEEVLASDLWIIPWMEVDTRLLRARNTSRALERRRQDPNNIPKKRIRKVKTSPKGRSFIVESPPITRMRGETIDMRVLPWYGHVYFSPVAWEIPPEQTQYINKYEKRVNHKGVYSHPDLDFQFYTLDFLRKIEMGGVAGYPQVYIWLETFQYMSREQLKKCSLTGDLLEQRLYYQPDNSARVNTPYTIEESSYIIDMYRPNMTEEQLKELKRLLPGREWASIGNHARKLCYEMIESGVTDIKDLPHRRRTEQMRIKIRKTKGQTTRNAARALREEKIND